MKRKDLILTSAGCFMFAVGCSQSGQPSEVDASIGSSAENPCASAAADNYSTTFAAAENPISEGGKWVNGKADGLLWNDVQTVPGKAYGADFIGSTSRYNDPIAHLSATFQVFTADQYAEATVSRVPGYSNPVDKHEVELLLRFEITANSARGYEVLWGQDGQIYVVRWNGPLGDYTGLGGLPAPGPGAAIEGDILRAEIVGNEITVCKNGEVVIIASDPDSMWSDGQPGIGFWPTNGSTLASYGWKTFEAGSL
jgi:hypothetical protein